MRGNLKPTAAPPLNRRNFLKKLGGSFISLAALTTFYPTFLERFWVEVNTVEIRFPRLPPAFSGLKLLQVSDIHFGYFYNAANLSNLVNKINHLHSDIICFTGDLIDESVDHLEECVPLLKQLSAPLGKVAILGNHDYRIGKQERVIQALEDSGFIVLRNKNMFIEKMGSRIHLAGVDDLFAEPDLEASVAGIPNDQFTILLAHEPDFADFSHKHPIDFQLSGHSHGGQIQIPYFGPLYKPDGAKVYYRGLYNVERSKTLLYVNRGIGTTYLPIRFCCRPEITQFSLRSSIL